MQLLVGCCYDVCGPVLCAVVVVGGVVVVAVVVVVVVIDVEVCVVWSCDKSSDYTCYFTQIRMHVPLIAHRLQAPCIAGQQSFV